MKNTLITSLVIASLGVLTSNPAAELHDVDESVQQVYGYGIDAGNKVYISLEGELAVARLGYQDPRIDDRAQDTISNNAIFGGCISEGQFLNANVMLAGAFNADDHFAMTVEHEVTVLTLAANHERFNSGDDTHVAELDRYAVSTRYGDEESGSGDTFASAGNGSFASEEGSDEIFDEFVLEATYGITDNDYMFAEAAAYGRDDEFGDGLAIGDAYLF